MKGFAYRASALVLVCVLVLSTIVFPAFATVSDALQYSAEAIQQWMHPANTDPLGGWNIVDFGSALFQSNKDQNYYTTPTQSVQDSNGNVTNYYRGGDTTNTKIIDSYNRTFNTIHNTNNYTNNYSANVKLNDFLNTYTTNNNNYTYSTDLQCWYYDTDNHNYNYTNNQTYFNTDNSKYYISIDNSTDEYYLVDVQYSPTFVTVNYQYNTTIANSNQYGDVTNVYYYELDDGRNSYTLTVSEALGIASGYDVTNYELVHDDPDTLSLQHFDGDYLDTSAYGRTFYSENRSTTFVDAGTFGKAVKLTSGSAAGVVIPTLPTDALQIDFRAYFDDIVSLSVYVGENVVFGRIPVEQSTLIDIPFIDDGEECEWRDIIAPSGSYIIPDSVSPDWSTELTSPSIDNLITTYSYNDFGCYYSLFSDDVNIDYDSGFEVQHVFYDDYDYSSSKKYYGSGVKDHYLSHVDVSAAFIGDHVTADGNFSSYTNQWVSFRISFVAGKAYFFVNGDLVGTGDFALPSGEKVVVRSTGTVYLDELRVSTGSLINTGVYTPSDAPFDTNMVLALPDELSTNTIYVRHQIPVNGWRIGGVRPSAPVTGFFYIPLHSDYTASQPLLYDGSNWVDVDAVISVDGVTTVSVVGFEFVPASGAPDVNPDLTSPGSGGSGSGSGSGDSSGDGSGSGDTDTDDSTGLLDGVLKKLFDLIGSVLGSILDGILSLANSVLDRLASAVNIFGSFGESLALLWSWLPAEIVSVLVTAVTVIIFVALLKVFI